MDLRTADVVVPVFPGYAPYNATPERNHWLGTAAGSLHPHEAPRFGRLRLPQLGAGVSRNGSVKLPDARRGGIFLQSLQPGHLTRVGIRTSGPYSTYRVCAHELRAFRAVCARKLRSRELLQL